MLKKICGIILCLSLTIGTGAIKTFAAIKTIPILMYHDITINETPDNPWSVTTRQFLGDMLYIKQSGYTAITPKTLIEIQSGAIPAPANPIMITFDDGYSSNYTYAYPILKSLGLNASISLVTSVIRQSLEEGDPQYLSWDQAREMSESGVIELGSHTHNKHNPDAAGGYVKGGVNGVARLENESKEQYALRVGSDISLSVKTIYEKTGAKAVYFAYPYGKYDEFSNDILLENGILVTSGVYHKKADLSKGLFMLPRLTVKPGENAMFVLSGKKSSDIINAEISESVFYNNNAEYRLKSFKAGQIPYISLSSLSNALSATNAAFSYEEDGERVLFFKGSHSLAQEGEKTGSVSASPVFMDLLIEGKNKKVAAYVSGGEIYIDISDLSLFLPFSTGWDSIKKQSVINF